MGKWDAVAFAALCVASLFGLAVLADVFGAEPDAPCVCEGSGDPRGE